MSELAKALVAAQRAAKAVEKKSNNAFAKYKYASAESMIGEAREALTEAGLAVIAAKTSIENGDLRVEYIVYHETGESLLCLSTTPIVEKNGTPADKAKATAATYDLGYFLRGLLLLPRVEEGTDVDQRDDTKHETLTVQLTRSLVEQFAGKIDSANDVETLTLLARDIKKAGLPDAARKGLVDKFTARKNELAVGDE